MALADFTTFGDIRAVLGVSTDDLPDAVISSDVYDFGLQAELYEMEPSPLEQYRSLVELDPEGMSDAERFFFQAVRMFSTYCVAKLLLAGLPLFAPKEHTDGKAGVTRFSQDPYKETAKEVRAQYDKAVIRVAATLAKLTAATAPVVTPRTMLAASALGVDPVTGS